MPEYWFATRHRYASELWERWLAVHDVETATALRDDSRMRAAFIAGVFMGIAPTEDERRRYEREYSALKSQNSQEVSS